MGVLNGRLYQRAAIPKKSPNRYILFGLFLILFVSAGCHPQLQPPYGSNAVLLPTTNTPSSSSTTDITALSTTASTTNVNWTTYADTTGGYALLVPSDWTIQPLDGGMIIFRDLNGSAMGEDKTVMGGIDILARYPASNEQLDYLQAIPNHADPLDNHSITTPAGSGQVFTLERSVRTENGSTIRWREQHALIPIKDKFYDIWLKVGQEDIGAAVPPLTRMLTSFRLIHS